MRKIFTAIFCAALTFAAVVATPAKSSRVAAVSPNLVIYQIYGGGGNSASSQYTHDYVVLFNRGDSGVSLDGWSTQYASATGSNWLVTPLPDFTLEPGKYFLIRYGGNNNGGIDPVPSPDFIAPPVTSGGNTFTPNLSQRSGKLALVNSASQLPASTCPSTTSIVDLLGYGSSASCFEGGQTGDLSATTALIRKDEGCDDTDNNGADFLITDPSPRNSGSPGNTCDIGSQITATGGASPSSVAPEQSTLLTVQVFPASSPPSTGISVDADLTNIGGSASQAFFDDGTNGDVSAGDNIFSFSATIPAGLGGGITTVSATAGDAQARTAAVVISLTINAPAAGEDPLLLGNPSNAVTSIASENNYLMHKPQYSLSYSRANATPNWVAWRLDTSWIGPAERQNDYRPDPALPAGWYRVETSDYTGSGFTRGHMCPSADRTRTVADNSATFLMTNFVPQIAENNSGPWVDFEIYLRSIANQGNEIYIFTGGAGDAGSIAQGRIRVPEVTWKVVLVLPVGNNDLERVTKSTRTIAIVVPNQLPLNENAPWRNFRTNIDAVEQMTGFDFLSNVPKITQELLERTRDRL